MKTKQLSLVFLIFAVILLSCKKESSKEKRDPKTPVQVDTAKLVQGVWRTAGLAYFSINLGSDGTFFQDWSNVGLLGYTGKYHVHKDSIIVTNDNGVPVGFGIAIIKKISADSLVLDESGMLIHHFRYTEPVSPYSITTIAGAGVAGSAINNGDGRAALSALVNPLSATQDSNGNIYIADARAYEVRILTADGKINKFAGPDNSYPHVIPMMQNPAAVYIHSGDDNLYYATQHAVYKLSLTTGTVTTMADLLDNSNLIIKSIITDKVGNVYIADVSGYKIYKIDAITNLVTELAGPEGTSVGRFYPTQLAVDESNHLFISDGYYNRILKLDLGTGEIKVFAGTGAVGFSGDGGPAITAQLSRPGGIAVDVAGNVYIADTGNGRLRKVDLSGEINTIAGRTYGYLMDGSDADKSRLMPGMLYINSKAEIFVTDAELFSSIPINVWLRKVFIP